MSESCSGNCSSCSSGCDSQKKSREDFWVPANKNSKIRKIIGVVSGKGGVGKSFVTSYLSVLLTRRGYKTAILDADVTGPSIPKAFGVHGMAEGTNEVIYPPVSHKGTKMISVNLLLPDEETPVVWRGPVIANTVKQFWADVEWGEVDYMLVDMPPGTGDVPLTVFQSIPLDGIIIVTSPQDLVSMIVAKAVNMAKTMEIPVLGIIENYSYVECDSCKKKLYVFGESRLEEVAARHGLKVLAQLPLTSVISSAIDQEAIEELNGPWLDGAVAYLVSAYPAR